MGKGVPDRLSLSPAALITARSTSHRTAATPSVSSIYSCRMAPPRCGIVLHVEIGLDDAALHDRLADATDGTEVDMLVLNDAPLWLRFRAVGGRVVFSRDERAPGSRTGDASRRSSSTSSRTTTSTCVRRGTVPGAGC